MILHAVFAYKAEVLAPRQRNPRERVFSGRVALEIREAAVGDVPVAFRWRERDIMDRLRAVHEIRWDGENLWKRVETEGPRDRRVARDAEWLSGRLDHRALDDGPSDSDPLGLRVFGHWKRDVDCLFIEQDATVASVRESDHDLRKAVVEARAAGLMSLDGDLYVKVPEPAYHVDWAGGLSNGRIRVKVVHPEDYSECGSLHWRLDEVDAVAATKGIEPGFRKKLVEVLIPEAVRAPLSEATLLQAGRRAEDAMGEELRRNGADFFAAFMAVRDANAALSAELSGPSPSTADGMPLADALAVALPHLVTLRGSDVNFPTYAETASIAALARYDAKALDLGSVPPCP